MTNEKSLEAIQEQVKEVTIIMKKNMETVLDRDDNLLILQEKSDNLEFNSKLFHNKSSQLKRKFWWKNIKFMLILSGIILFLILIVSLIIWSATK